MPPSAEPEVLLSGGQPFRRQIYDQIVRCVRSGSLHPGEPLPTVRALAAALGINPAAVRRAYARLEADGYVSTEDGSGTFVAALTSRPDRTRLQRLCEKFLTYTERLGFAPADVRRAVAALAERRSMS